jgi:hypothetical protein
MTNINEITNAIFTELGSTSKSIAVHNEGKILVIKVGDIDTRIMNWEMMSVSSILDIAKGLVLKENFKGNVLLHG